MATTGGGGFPTFNGGEGQAAEEESKGQRWLYFWVVALVVILLLLMLVAIGFGISSMYTKSNPVFDTMLRRMAFPVTEGRFVSTKIDVVVQATYKNNGAPTRGEQLDAAKLDAALTKADAAATGSLNAFAEHVVDLLWFNELVGMSVEVFAETVDNNTVTATCTKGDAPRLLKVDAV